MQHGPSKQGWGVALALLLWGCLGATLCASSSPKVTQPRGLTALARLYDTAEHFLKHYERRTAVSTSYFMLMGATTQGGCKQSTLLVNVLKKLSRLT